MARRPPRLSWGLVGLLAVGLLLVGGIGLSRLTGEPPGASPTTAAASPTGTTEPVTVTVDTTTLAQDTLVDPVLSGRVSGDPGTVRAQRWTDGAWTTLASATPDGSGAFSLVLDAGHGEIRTDRWRVLAGTIPSAEVTVDRLGVVAPAGHTPTRDEVASSWREGCPVSYTSLRVVEANFYGFDDRMHRGAVVVNAAIEDATVALLQTTIDARFPLASLTPVEAYGASDQASMAANNSSAFNCRPITRGTGWSRHAYGRAIDLNPVQNPYLPGGVQPAAGAEYLDRSDVRPGMLVPGSPVVSFALNHGWTWLNPSDVQHFER